MNKKVISTSKAPKAIGPYSQAVLFENLVFTSGNLALNRDGILIGAGDIEKQSKQTMENLKIILEESGSDLNCVLKTTCFLKNMDDFVLFNNIYSTYFSSSSAPARSTVEVSRLPKDVLVEVEAIAYLR